MIWMRCWPKRECELTASLTAMEGGHTEDVNNEYEIEFEEGLLDVINANRCCISRSSLSILRYLIPNEHSFTLKGAGAPFYCRANIRRKHPNQYTSDTAATHLSPDAPSPARTHPRSTVRSRLARNP